MYRSNSAVASRAAIAMVVVLALVAASCRSGVRGPGTSQIPAGALISTPAAVAPEATPPTAASVQPEALPSPLPTSVPPMDEGPLVLGAGEFQQASFPDEAGQLASAVLGEPTRTTCHRADSCQYEWDLPEHGSRFEVSKYGWALWGEPLVASIDDRFQLAGIKGDPTDISAIVATDPYMIYYIDGLATKLCSLTICFSAVAGNSLFDPADGNRMAVIFGSFDTVEGRATVVGSEPVPFQNELGLPYEATEGQELWVRPGFSSLNGTYWVNVITDDHRGFAMPMDRLQREGRAVDMLTAHRVAQDATTALLVEQLGPLDVLALTTDGVGPVEFGGSADDAIDIVIASLGEPTTHVTSTRFTPSVRWSTDGGDFWLDYSDGVLKAWHYGDRASWFIDDAPPAEPLGANASISIDGAPIPLQVSDLTIAGPWGVEELPYSLDTTIRTASGLRATAKDGLLVQLRGEGRSQLAEMWISNSTDTAPGALGGLNLGDRVFVDQDQRQRDATMVFVYTNDHRAGWVSESILTTEQP